MAVITEEIIEISTVNITIKEFSLNNNNDSNMTYRGLSRIQFCFKITKVFNLQSYKIISVQKGNWHDTTIVQNCSNNVKIYYGDTTT